MIIKNRNLEEFEYKLILGEDKHIYYEINAQLVNYNDINGIDNFIFFVIKRKPFGNEICQKYIANSIHCFYEILKNLHIQSIISNKYFNGKSIEEVYNQLKIGHLLKYINN